MERSVFLGNINIRNSDDNEFANGWTEGTNRQIKMVARDFRNQGYKISVRRYQNFGMRWAGVWVELKK